MPVGQVWVKESNTHRCVLGAGMKGHRHSIDLCSKLCRSVCSESTESEAVLRELQGTQGLSLKCAQTSSIVLWHQPHMTRAFGCGGWRGNAGRASWGMLRPSCRWKATKVVAWLLETGLDKFGFGISTAHHARGSCGMCTRGM